MEAPPVDEPGRIRFPALDPEPPPRAWWRRLLTPMITLVVAGAVAAGVTFALSPGRPERRAASPARHHLVTADGRVLAETLSGRLFVAAPGGAHATRLGKLGPYPPSPLLAASADGRYVATPSGDVLALSGPGRPAAHSRLTIAASMIPAPLGPFADHDHYLVLVDNTYGEASTDVTVTLGSLATGDLRTLANADQAAADPAAPGAFLSVAAPPSPRDTALHGYPDSRVELADAGARPVVLATAQKLARAAGASARTPVTLTPFPSPDGSQVAIAVQPLPASPKGAMGIVVLTRAGKVAGTVPASLGATSPPAWSAAGTSLAFMTPSNVGQALTMWSPDGQSQTVPVPVSGAEFARCLWSSNGASVLCSDQNGRTWVLIPASGGAGLGAVPVMPGRGMPIAWLPGRRTPVSAKTG